MLRSTKDPSLQDCCVGERLGDNKGSMMKKGRVQIKPLKYSEKVIRCNKLLYNILQMWFTQKTFHRTHKLTNWHHGWKHYQLLGSVLHLVAIPVEA